MDVVISFLEHTNYTVIMIEIESYPRVYNPCIWETVDPGELVCVIFNEMDAYAINSVLEDIHNGINLHQVIITESIHVFGGYISVTNPSLRYIKSDINVCLLDYMYDNIVEFDCPNG